MPGRRRDVASDMLTPERHAGFFKRNYAPGTMMASELGSYNELCCYTLTHLDQAFLHQHVVDAFAAQHANELTKPIALTFALAGLYLHIEKLFSGRQVQQAHMKLARRKQPWPSFALPEDRGSMTAAHVMLEPPGRVRDKAIDTWCASVWNAFRESHEAVAQLLRKNEIV
jgi:Family of unknown function (DUF5946)